jgi:hypothetical protein
MSERGNFTFYGRWPSKRLQCPRQIALLEGGRSAYHLGGLPSRIFHLPLAVMTDAKCSRALNGWKFREIP